jgi:hypothetical protein
LDQQRLELQLNHKGIVLSVNPGASKSVFGFNPQDLVGRPLAAFVNLFSQWRGKFGEDESLLVMLGMRAEQGLDVIYRCGVHNPFSDEELARGAGADESSLACCFYVFDHDELVYDVFLPCEHPDNSWRLGFQLVLLSGACNVNATQAHPQQQVDSAVQWAAQQAA